MMLYSSLENYYRVLFMLKQHHQLSIADYEGMIPWEREIYLSLLQAYLEENKPKT